MKKGFTLVVLMMFVIFPIALFSAPMGNVTGKVTIEKTGDPLPNAAVFLTEEQIGTYTKKNGSYTLEDLNPGTYEVNVSFMGYKKQSKQVEVVADQTTILDFAMIMEAIELMGVKVNETRAIKRETPIAFTDISQQAVSDKYTTEDVPQLIEGVPGLFATTGGLGEGELRVRGFDQDKVQILINGIPVNDPESQQVYWSNWTGLSSNVKSVQVQRGAGSSLYGSGAFGGSINIETIGVGADPMGGWTLRTSAGTYSSPDKVADGKGNLVDYSPFNYNMMLKYRSGNLYGGKFNYAVSVERKVGDYYLIGTNYDGWSFGTELQNLWGNHKVNTSLIIAPQEHNQARTTTDMALIDDLGRNYNRNNNPEQLNYYNKPQLSIRDEWKITDETVLMTNFFFTRGDGGGAYLKNDRFDVETGKIMYMEVSENTDNKYFGRHAYDVAINYGIELDGIEIFWNEDETEIDSVYFNGSLIDYGYNLPNRDYNHTWVNDSQNHHKQFGLNTYLDHQLNDMIKLTAGGEWRHWKADHTAYSYDFRYFGGVYDEAQTRYSYKGIVTNLSTFARAQIKPIPNLNIMLDGQYAVYKSEVEENPIQIFDYQLGMFVDEWVYATKHLFNEDDYEKTYDFFSPKVGANLNVTDRINIIGNYSIAYKEPRVTDWYSRSDGPDANQTYIDSLGNEVVEKLDPEKASTFELGLGYDGIGWNVLVNYYNTKYEDKLESTYTEEGEYLTINAGEATHKGVEFEGNLVYNNFDLTATFTYSRNRWDKMNVEEIFYEDAEEVEDKIVPYSPEKMGSVAVGYTFYDMPMDGQLRIGFSAYGWNEYYGNYTNEYYQDWVFEDPDDPWSDAIPVESSLTDAKLPYYLTISSDISYKFKIAGKDASIRLDLKNINNRKDNYSRAYWTADYGRNDALNSIYHMYVTPAPLFHAFLTAEVNF